MLAASTGNSGQVSRIQSAATHLHFSRSFSIADPRQPPRGLDAHDWQLVLSAIDKYISFHKLTHQQVRPTLDSTWSSLFSWQPWSWSAQRCEEPARYAVWLCTEFCGGLSDRLRGLWSMLVFSMFSGRIYLLDDPQLAPLDIQGGT